MGNSCCIRLPKVILHQIDITDEVDLKVDRNRIILKPFHSPQNRLAWVYKKMVLKSDERLLDREKFIIRNSLDVVQ